MSTKTYLFLLSLIAGCHLLQAQTVEPLTLDDVTPGGRTYWSHQPSTPMVCGLTGDGVITYDKEGLKLVDKSGRETDLLTLQEWSQIAGAPAKAIPWLTVYGNGDYLSRSTDKGIDFIDLKSGTIAKHFTYDSSRWQQLQVAPGAAYLVLSDGETMALLESGAAEPRELVSDSSHDIVYGMPAARNEFGTESGIFISPSGRYFAFYRIDQSEVTDYPIVRIHRPIAESDPLKYPMAGQSSQRTTVGIYDTTDGSIHYLATGEPTDRYFTNLSWGVLGAKEVVRCRKVRRQTAGVPSPLWRDGGHLAGRKCYPIECLTHGIAFIAEEVSVAIIGRDPIERLDLPLPLGEPADQLAVLCAIEVKVTVAIYAGGADKRLAVTGEGNRLQRLDVSLVVLL